jgi:predicted MPP superfamily phosphohydrolase
VEALRRAAVVLLYLIAGGCVFVFLLNRYLISMKDRKRKPLAIWVSFAAITAGALYLGCAECGALWTIAPILIVALALLGEARRVVIRRQYRGEPPVERQNNPVSLRKPITTTDLAIARYEVRCPNWQGDRLRIAHMSDFHVNAHLPLSYYRMVMERVAEAHPDLVMLTGDFVSTDEAIPLLADVLAGARGRLETFAVLGNHDHWAGGPEVARAVRSAGITVLENDCRRVTIGDGNDVVICGYDDPWGHSGAWRAPRATPAGLALVLTHTPDNIYHLSGPGITAVFAGHYHAGQIKIPPFGALVVPSAYGRRFDHGHFIVNGTHLFVSAGIGSAAPPFRIYCQPDVFIVDLTGERGS